MFESVQMQSFINATFVCINPFIAVLDLGVTRPDLLECLVLASSIAFGIIVGALSMPLDCHSKVKRVVTVNKRADKSGDLKKENVPICPAAKTTASEFSGTAGERVDDCADTSLLEVERDAAAGRLSATLLADKGDDEAVPPITPFHSPATSPASASSSSSMPDAFPSSSISSSYSSLADTGLSPALVVPLPFGIKFAATMRRLEQKVLEILASPASPNDWMYEGMDSGVKIHSKTVSDVDSFFKREGAPTPAAPATPPVSSLSSSSSLLLARGEGTVCGLSAAQFMALIWCVIEHIKNI